MSSKINQRLTANNITLPEAGAPAANYLPYTITANQLFISGQLPLENGQIAIKGRLGEEVKLVEGVRAAELCAINILAQAQAALGNLERIKRVIKINGYVASASDFNEQHLVINGASDLIVDILGDAGKHARAAVGMAALPLNASVEIDAIIEFE